MQGKRNCFASSNISHTIYFPLKPSSIIKFHLTFHTIYPITSWVIAMRQTLMGAYFFNCIGLLEF